MIAHHHHLLYNVRLGVLGGVFGIELGGHLTAASWSLGQTSLVVLNMLNYIRN